MRRTMGAGIGCVVGLGALASCLDTGLVEHAADGLGLTDIGYDEVDWDMAEGTGACTSNVVFLNFGGGQYTTSQGANDDPRLGRSVVVAGLLLTKSTVTAAVSASAQASLQQCLDRQFAAYNVHLTTTRPSPECGYREIVIGRMDSLTRSRMSARNEAVGTAPRPWNCRPTDNAIGFVDSDLASSVPSNGIPSLCAVTAHEMGHTFGLRHVPNTSASLTPGDLMMASMRNRNAVGFRDVDEWCAECVQDWPNPNVPNQCRPDRKQNSHRRLLEVLGGRGGGASDDGRGGGGTCDREVECQTYAGCAGGDNLCLDPCTGDTWCEPGLEN